MKSNQPIKQKAVKLFVIWVISFLGLNAISVYRNLNLILFGEQLATERKPDLFLFIFLLAVAAYFIPMLVAIYRQAKLEEIKWLTTTSKLLLIFFVAYLVVAVFILLCMAFMWT